MKCGGYYYRLQATKADPYGGASSARGTAIGEYAEEVPQYGSYFIAGLKILFRQARMNYNRSQNRSVYKIARKR